MKQSAAPKAGQGQNRFKGRKGPGARAPAFIVLLVLAQALLACSLLMGDELQDPAAAPVAGPSLTCTQECADRGQCGQSSDRGPVVLLSSSEPGLSPVEFDLAITDGSAVIVNDERSMTVQENSSGNQFSVDFYRVFAPERGVEGWVAAWCIMNPGS